MDNRTMQYNLAVIREDTIFAAAQTLHVAQPSLSRQMKELEDELGTTLFVRGIRRFLFFIRSGMFRKILRTEFLYIFFFQPDWPEL